MKTEHPVWIADPAHAWLKVPLEYVKASGYKPSEYSYRFGGFAYLEEDCDAPRYLRHIGVWDGERGTFPKFPTQYIHNFDRNRPVFSGVGFQSWSKSAVAESLSREG